MRPFCYLFALALLLLTPPSHAQWQVFDADNTGVPGSRIVPHAVEPDGTLWATVSDGTASYGITRFDGTTWTLYSTDNSVLPSNNIREVALAPDGSLWLATAGGLVHIDDVGWTAYTPSNSGLPEQSVRDVGLDASGIVWAVTEGEIDPDSGLPFNTLVRFDGSSWTSFDAGNSAMPVQKAIRTLAVGADGTVWLGLYGDLFQRIALVRFDGAMWVTYERTPDRTPGPDIADLTVGADGVLWLAQSAWRVLPVGIARLDGEAWTVYTPDNSDAPLPEAQTISVDGPVIWAGNGWSFAPPGYITGYINGGLARFDGAAWTYFGEGSGLPVSTHPSGGTFVSVLDVAVAEGGPVWVGTAEGLAVNDVALPREPVDGATSVVLTPTLDWNSAFGTDAYRVQVAETEDFSSVLVEETVAGPPYSVPLALEPTTTYYWRVLSEGGERVARRGGGSAVYHFTTGASTANETGGSVQAQSLEPVLPNPARGDVVLRFSLATGGLAHLSVYDVLGRRVAVLVDEERGSGEHTVRWDARGLPGGTYVVRLKAAANVFSSRRLTLVR